MPYIAKSLQEWKHRYFFINRKMKNGKSFWCLHCLLFHTCILKDEPRTCRKNISCVQITDDFMKTILTFNKGSDLPFFPKLFEFLTWPVQFMLNRQKTVLCLSFLPLLWMFEFQLTVLKMGSCFLLSRICSVSSRVTSYQLNNTFLPTELFLLFLLVP